MTDAHLPGYTLAPPMDAPDDLSVFRLLNERGKDIYTKRRVFQEGYTSSGGGYESWLEDSLSGAHLSKVVAPNSNSKLKSIQLFNPDLALSFSHVGKMSYNWRFEYEEEVYEWRQGKMSKEFICWMVRKPDPDVDVVRARPADSKGPASITLHHYNLQRFDTADPKGLEILFITTFLSFLDAQFDRDPSTPIYTSTLSPPQLAPRRTSDRTNVGESSSPPPIPPKPQRLVKEEEELEFGDFEEPPDPNEVIIRPARSVSFYAEKAFVLLNDPSMLFVILRSRSIETVQKAVLVAEELKRLRHQNYTLLDPTTPSSDIFQYVIEETSLPPKPSPPPSSSQSPPPTRRAPPRTINLNDPTPLRPSNSPAGPPPAVARGYQQPWEKDPIVGLSIYLSKIELPDLKPKIKPTTSFSSTRTTSLPTTNGPANGQQPGRQQLSPPRVSAGGSGSSGGSIGRASPSASNAGRLAGGGGGAAGRREGRSPGPPIAAFQTGFVSDGREDVEGIRTSGGTGSGDGSKMERLREGFGRFGFGK